MTAKEDLIAAIKSGDDEAASRIVAAKPSVAAEKDDNGISLILLALYYQHKDIAVLLRGHRDDLDAFEAAALGEIDVFQRLFGPQPDFTSIISADGFTPLHLAAFFRRKAAARFLLAHGADPDAKAENQSEVRPIHSACAARDAGMVRILLAAGANPDIAQTGGHTALHAACLHADEAMIRALISAGAVPHLKNDEGKSPADLVPEEQAWLRTLVQ